MKSGPGPTSNSLAVGCEQPWDKTLTVSPQVEASKEFWSSCLMMRKTGLTQQIQILKKHTQWPLY